MILVGVDIGLSGAIAFYDTATELVLVHDMPTLTLARGGKTKREIDTHALVQIISSAHPGHAFIEQVSSMPGQGVSGVFAFGKSYGIVLGIIACLGVPYTLVAPVKWKRALGVPAAKDGARARASQLLPAAADQWKLVKHDGRAEAALICLYGFRSFGAIGKTA